MSEKRKLSENAIHEIFMEAANEKYPHSHQVLWLIWHIEALEEELEAYKALANAMPVTNFTIEVVPDKTYTCRICGATVLESKSTPQK